MVKAGETVEVTVRGNLFALLVPPANSDLASNRLIASGRLIPAKRPIVVTPRTILSSKKEPASQTL